jgi:hypothetical protein
MERRWHMKNVDLDLLVFRIGDFFKENNFEVIGEETSINYRILAKNSPSYRLLGLVEVTIEGTPADFVLKLELSGTKKRFAVYSTLLTMFGGGYLVLQEVESDEAWEKLNKQFWPYVENMVLYLTNSKLVR